jgi:hypothetical protein
MITNSKLRTQNSKLLPLLPLFFALCSMLLFCLFSTPCFAQFVLANPMWRVPSLPNLPSGEKEYEVGATISGSPETELDLTKLNSLSRPTDTQGNLKTDTHGVVKPNKYKIGYNGDTGRIQSRIEKNKGTKQEDLKASEFPGQPLRLPDTRSLGFQYRPPLLGRIGLDAGVGKPNEQAQE